MIANDPPATTDPNTAEALAEESDPRLVALIRAELEGAGGRITFARFMELALYHPSHGYYLTPERRPGRGGDFLTAPEASPLFGLTLARQLVDCWERLGRPERWVVREYGAGVGGLAYDLLAGLSHEAPAARAGLEYRLVEPNQHRREEALAGLAAAGFAGTVRAEEATPAGELPPITGVIIANEVADALPVHRLVVRNRRLRERYVVWRREASDEGWFAEEEGEVSSPDLGESLWARLLADGVTPRDGDRLDVSPAAAAWFAGAARGLARGYAIVIDYGYPAAELYRDHRLEGTVRAYAGHTVTDDPFRRIGRQDLTAHVDFTALERAGEAAGLAPAGLTTQGAFLASLGLGDFLQALQQDPTTTPADYYAAQAAALRLIDPGGLGRFRVLLMARDAPVAPPLRGLAISAPAF